MKVLLWLIIAVGFGMIPVALAQSGEPAGTGFLPPFQTLTITYKHNGTTDTVTHFIDGVNGRMRVGATEPPGRYLYLRLGSSSYSWRPGEEGGFYGDYAVPPEAVWARVIARTEGLVKVGDEEILGRPCAIYEDRETRRAETYRVWVWNHLIMKEELIFETFRSARETRFREAVWIQPDVPIEEKLFDPPGYQPFEDGVVSYLMPVKAEYPFKSLVITYRKSSYPGGDTPEIPDTYRTHYIDAAGMRIRLEDRLDLRDESPSVSIKDGSMWYSGAAGSEKMIYRYTGPLGAHDIWEGIAIHEAIVNVPRDGRIERELPIRVGEEEILGRASTIYERKYGAMRYLIWVWNGVVMKEQTFSTEELTGFREAVSLDVDVPIEEEKFTPPKGVQLQPWPMPPPPAL